MLAPGGPEEYDILPEIISKEPLGPVVRKDDEEWLTLIKWVLYALIEAEERGVTQANVRTLLNTSTDPGLRRFLASDGLPEKALGLKPGWVVRVIEAVGNYGEIYERHLGSQSETQARQGAQPSLDPGRLDVCAPLSLTGRCHQSREVRYRREVLRGISCMRRWPC